MLLGVEATDDHGAALFLREGRAGRKEESGSSPDHPGQQGRDRDVVVVVPGIKLVLEIDKGSLLDDVSKC